MSAIDCFLADLIDYAGLFPPAGLDIRSAFGNYLRYMKGKHASMLGRFVVDIDRLPELRKIAGDAIWDLRLTIIAPPTTNWDSLPRLFDDDGLPFDSIEIRTDQLTEIKRLGEMIPSGIATYFEVPISSIQPEALSDIAAIGARAKLRTGGIVAEAFPNSEEIAGMLKMLADRGIPFKTTSGLHHPVRSHHPFTYEPNSASGMMHGFLNVFLAATLLYFGGATSEARQLLEEESPEAFTRSSDGIEWRSFHWTKEQLRSVRNNFAISFGSCSFEEPLHDLEAMGWLK